MTTPQRAGQRRSWPVPAALLALTLIPLVGRLVFVSAMAAGLLPGATAIRRRDIVAHRAGAPT